MRWFAFMRSARVKKTHSAKRDPAMYCESKARSAPSTVKPIPTIPVSTLAPSSAIQSPLRIDNAGRRAAEGLFGCVAQYDSISSNAIRAGSARWKAFLDITSFFLLILENKIAGGNTSAAKIAQSGTRWIYYR
jgi:hypothetical protein